MRLYLSSFGMGDHPEHLLALAGQGSRRAVVIANALDDAPPDVRRAGAERELAALTGLGLDAAELDLRGYFGPRQLLRRDLAGSAWPGWPGTAPTASRTAPCATGRPCSSAARRR